MPTPDPGLARALMRQHRLFGPAVYGRVSYPAPTLPGMTRTPSTPAEPEPEPAERVGRSPSGSVPLYTSETPSHVPTRTPTEPNVVKRDDVAFTVDDVDDADDLAGDELDDGRSF